MSLSNDIEHQRDARLGPNKPDSEGIQQNLRDIIIYLTDLIRAQKIVFGTADSNPPSTTPSQLTDAAPTTGALTDIVIGQTLEIVTSDRAEQKRFTITAVNLGSDEIEVAENLFLAGVRSGDEYRVIFNVPTADDKGHCHDGIDSEFIPKPNLAAMYAFGGD